MNGQAGDITSSGSRPYSASRPITDHSRWSRWGSNPHGLGPRDFKSLAYAGSATTPFGSKVGPTGFEPVTYRL